RRHACAGFTLIELAIVLAIIGLLVGAIIGGQEMVQASRLNATIKEAQNVREAFLLFREKYNDLPGDMSDAASYWSACTNATNNPCNGDGNGRMQGNSTSGSISEQVRAWQHLALSGIAPGNYTGLITSPLVAGQNIAPSSVNGAGL